MKDTTMIEVRNLDAGYGKTVLLHDISLDIDVADIFAIMGGSGCGKSTLMRHIVGLQPPLAGSITIRGIGEPTLEDLAPRYGVAFQSGALFSSMTTGENVAFALNEWTDLPDGAISAIVRSKLSLVGLEEAVDKMPSELSGGMLKRAAIARAMALEPEILFLDEPSAGLDPISAAGIDELLKALNRDLGVTIVLVTHDLQSVYAVAKNCILLDRESKGIIAQGDPRKLRDEFDDPRAKRFFNRETVE